MPLRRIEESPIYKWSEEFCISSEHNPPGNMVFESGHYEWECPKCGKITTFFIPKIIC